MKTQSDIRSSITATIIEALTNGGLPPWRKMWSNDPNAPGLHTSMSTGNPYRGINQLLLQCSAMKCGFKSKWWGTFNQIKQNGASVSRGAKGTQVVLFKKIERERVDEAGDEVKDNFFVMRAFTVFNAEQTTGLEQFRVGFAKPQNNSVERYEAADDVRGKKHPASPASGSQNGVGNVPRKLHGDTFGLKPLTAPKTGTPA